MSLRQGYTWNEFLKEQGEKAKEWKRTSSEGQKAFENARKAKLKTLVENRIQRYQSQKEKTQNQIGTLRGSLKGLKSRQRKRSLIKKISRKESFLRDCSQQIKRDQARSL